MNTTTRVAVVDDLRGEVQMVYDGGGAISKDNF